MPWIAKVHSVVAKLARVVEEYERTPSPTMIRIGDRRPDPQWPAVKH
jgi:hypothetical protein